MAQPCRHSRAGRQVSRPAIRRPAAACRHRSHAVYGTPHPHVRRADLSPRPGDDQEVLDVMRDLAVSGYTILAVTHEMGFARTVADR